VSILVSALVIKSTQHDDVRMLLSAGARYRSISPSGVALQQQTRRPPLLLSIDSRERDGRTDARPLHRSCSAYYADSVKNVFPCYMLGSRVVRVLDSGAEGSGFKSQPRRCQVTVLGKLFTPIVLCASVHQAAELVAALFRVVRVTAGLVESNGILPPIHVTSRLTAKNRDQLQNPTLGSRVWTTFTFTLFTCYMGQ